MSQNLAGDVAAPAGAVAADELDGAVGAASRALSAQQQADGHFIFQLEADATIPAEYVLFTHWRGEAADGELERKIGNYLRRIQGVHGGWPLFHGGRLNVSASVKAYFALKMIGDDPRAPHMARAATRSSPRVGRPKATYSRVRCWRSTGSSLGAACR